MATYLAGPRAGHRRSPDLGHLSSAAPSPLWRSSVAAPASVAAPSPLVDRWPLGRVSGTAPSPLGPSGRAPLAHRSAGRSATTPPLLRHRAPHHRRSGTARCSGAGRAPLRRRLGAVRSPLARWTPIYRRSGTGRCPVAARAPIVAPRAPVWAPLLRSPPVHPTARQRCSCEGFEATLCPKTSPPTPNSRLTSSRTRACTDTRAPTGAPSRRTVLNGTGCARAVLPSKCRR